MKILIAGLIGFIIAQLLKIIKEVILTKRLKWNYFWETGNFPSSHTAGLTAVTTALYFEEGFSSLFFFAIIILFLVIRDATGVRFAVGENSKKINELARKAKIKEVDEILGHTPIQVLAGLLIGIIVTILLYLF